MFLLFVIVYISFRYIREEKDNYSRTPFIIVQVAIAIFVMDRVSNQLIQANIEWVKYFLLYPAFIIFGLIIGAINKGVILKK